MAMFECRGEFYLMAGGASAVLVDSALVGSIALSASLGGSAPA